MKRYHFSPRTRQAEKCSAEHQCQYGDTAHIENPSPAALEDFERQGLENLGESVSTFSSVSKTEHEADPEKVEALQDRLKSQQKVVIGLQERLENDDSLDAVQRNMYQNMLKTEQDELRAINDELADEYNGVERDNTPAPDPSLSRSVEGEAGIYSEPSAARGPRRKREGDHKPWGNTPNLRVGSNTPWGKADYVDKPADGIAVVGTPSHGGVKLSAERNRGIPEELRNRDAWYEEDTESQIVGYYYPEAFPHFVHAEGGREQAREHFASSLKNWYPDAYEKVTGEEVSPEESYTRREQIKKAEDARFRQENKNEFISTGFSPTTTGKKEGAYAFVPDGYEVLNTKKESTGEERQYLVPKHEALPEGQRVWNDRLVIDPERHVDVTGVLAAGNSAHDTTQKKDTIAPQYGDEVSYSTEGLTAAQAEKAEKELNKRYRFQDDDGNEVIETKLEHLQRQGIQGKRRFHDGDKEGYWVHRANSNNVTPVSKAEFLALNTEDTTSERDAANIELSKAQVSHERAKDRFRNNAPFTSPTEKAKFQKSLKNAEARYQKAAAVSEEYRTKEREDYLNRHDDAAQRSARAWADGPAAGFNRSKHRNHPEYKNTVSRVESWALGGERRAGLMNDSSHYPTEDDVRARVMNEVGSNPAFADMDTEERRSFVERTQTDLLSRVMTRSDIGERVE